jgi:hypothetical protein
MRQSEHFFIHAKLCAQLAQVTTHMPTRSRYKRMEAAWRALAEEQDWLDGQVAPAPIAATSDATKTPP